MSDAEFFAELTGGQNDFARAVEALRAARRPFCLIGAGSWPLTTMSNPSSRSMRVLR